MAMREIEKYIDSGIKKDMFTAASVRVVRNGSVYLEDARGLLDPTDPSRKTRKDSIFDLASLTKAFVATAFMKLVEDQLASLDQPIVDVVPSFSDGAKKDITFRQLLSHSSGLPASFNLYENGEWNKGKEVVIRKLISAELVYQPGTQMIYSCLGFMLLGYAMEKISGEELDQTLDKLLFKPLNLKDILYKPGDELRDRIVITTDERPNRGRLRPGVVHDGNAIALNGGVSGNAGLFGKAESVSRLGEIFYNKIFLKEQTIDEMTKLQAQYEGKKRGLGWQLHSYDDSNSARVFSETSFGHTGFTGTSLWVDPQNRVIVSFLTNSVRFYKQEEDAERFNSFRLGLYEKILKEI